MGRFGQAVSQFAQNFVAFVLMIVLAVISFFFTVYVVNLGATLAGYPNDQYVVLSAALLVSAATLAGGISPLGFLSTPSPQSRQGSERAAGRAKPDEPTTES